MIKIGISEVNITPQDPLPRAGMPFPQKGQGTDWPLMGRIFVFDNGIHRAGVVTLDLLGLTAQTVAEFRQAMTIGTGITPDEIMITCTHTHWAPHTAAIMDEDADFAYLDRVRAKLVEGMSQALASSRPAQLRVGSIEAPGWAFNRRPVYQTPAGDQVGTQGPQWVDHFLYMEGPDDPQLLILQALDESNQPLGGLVNFACHTTVGPDDPLYSADYPGPLTARLSRDLGGIYGFIQGCAGNIWQQNMREPQDPQRPQTGSVYTVRMGEALAEKAKQALHGAVLVHNPRLRVGHEILKIAQRRPTRQQIEQARWFLEKRTSDADLQDHMRRMTGYEYTFYHSIDHLVEEGIERDWMLWQEDWFARGILGLWEYQRRSGMREVMEQVEVQVIAIGDLALVGYPAEYFVEYGLKTRANSPFPYTLVSELANGWHGYVPTPSAFTHGGYETRLGDASRLVMEAGDAMYDTGSRLLKQLWHR